MGEEICLQTCGNFSDFGVIDEQTVTLKGFQLAILHVCYPFHITNGVRGKASSGLACCFVIFVKEERSFYI